MNPPNPLSFPPPSGDSINQILADTFREIYAELGKPQKEIDRDAVLRKLKLADRFLTIAKNTKTEIKDDVLALMPQMLRPGYLSVFLITIAASFKTNGRE